MNISLTPELESAVKAKVSSGLYNDVSAVVRDALCKFLFQEQETRVIAREASTGYAQLQTGQTVEVESKQHFTDLVRGGQAKPNPCDSEECLLTADADAPEMTPERVRQTLGSAP